MVSDQRRVWDPAIVLRVEGGGSAVDVSAACVCPDRCDCQRPEGPGVRGFSNQCPEHNDRPFADPDCEADEHRNGAW